MKGMKSMKERLDTDENRFSQHRINANCKTQSRSFTMKGMKERMK
jgi:hypothetical protein